MQFNRIARLCRFYIVALLWQRSVLKRNCASLHPPLAALSFVGAGGAFSTWKTYPAPGTARKIVRF